MEEHLLSKFRYCPVCGAADFAEGDFKSKHCSQCGFTYYLNSAAAVVGVVLNERGEVLVARRAFDPAKGTLDLPGGFVDPDETFEQALARELEEEAGIEVEPVRWLFSIPNRYLFSGFHVPTTDSFVLCRLRPGAKPKAHDDVAELFWVRPEELRPERFGLRSIAQGVERLLPMLRDLI